MFTWLQEIFARAAESEFFYGGLALGLMGALAGFAHIVRRGLADTVQRRWTAVVTVDNRSPAFGHLCLWLDHTGALGHVRHLRSTPDAGVAMMPDGGPFWFWQDGCLCRYARQIDAKMRAGNSGRPLESITLTLPFQSPVVVQGWIREGARIAAAIEWTGPSLHVLRGDWWANLGVLSPRPLDTILTDDDRVENLARDMRWFFASEDWYRQRGVPWRRGYLLHGPPGTGKSSVIRALASELETGIASVSLSGANLTDEDLREGLGTAPEGSLIVLEDIDAMFSGRESETPRERVSFSGLLNAIDGIGAQEGRVLVMTTNHPERLDPALVRPGRADVHVAFGPVSAATAARLFIRFFPDEAALAAQFQEALGARTVMPAQLQAWLLEHAADPRIAARGQGLITAPVSLAAE